MTANETFQVLTLNCFTTTIKLNAELVLGNMLSIGICSKGSSIMKGHCLNVSLRIFNSSKYERISSSCIFCEHSFLYARDKVSERMAAGSNRFEQFSSFLA